MRILKNLLVKKTFNCPERNTNPIYAYNKPNRKGFNDYWDKRKNGDRCCSYCGSLHPDDVIDILTCGNPFYLETSTKSYKIYVSREGVQNAGDGGIKYYRWHDNEGFIDRAIKAEKANKHNNLSIRFKRHEYDKNA